MTRPINLVGQRFGRLEVIREAGNNKHGQRIFLCRCDCGKEIETKSYYLRQGDTKSCGCLHRECVIRQETTHGRTRTPEWNSWVKIKQRCTDPNDKNYKSYGGNGRTMAPEWIESFELFLTEIGPKPIGLGYSVDRIDNTKGYVPGNIRWATWKEQANNRSSTVLYSYNGIDLCISDWAKEIGVKRETISDLLKKAGLSVGEIASLFAIKGLANH